VGLGTKLRNAALRLFLKGVARDIQKGEYGTVLKNLWDALDGKKTWLGLIVTFSPEFIRLIAEVITAGGGSPDMFVRIGGTFVVVVGALHKLVKGE